MRNVRSVIETPAYVAASETYQTIRVPFLSDLSPELDEWFSMWGITSPVSIALTTDNPLHRPLQCFLI